MNTSSQPRYLSRSAVPASDRWFRVAGRCPAPSWRLVCFPFAGAGASVYHSWGKYLAQRNIEVWNVQYPGRENRLAEDPVREFDSMVRQLTEALRSLEAAEVPLAFFGHSLGALFAHEVTNQLWRQGRPLPASLFLSGSNAPSHRRKLPPLHQLPSKDLLDAVAEFGNLSPAVRNDPELVELLLPALRADFEIIHDYDQRREPGQVIPLECPISVFAGEQDPWTDAEGLKQWRQFARGQFRLRTYAGGHFFINEFRQNIWRAIDEDLNGRVG